MDFLAELEIEYWGEPPVFEVPPGFTVTVSTLFMPAEGAPIRAIVRVSGPLELPVPTTVGIDENIPDHLCQVRAGAARQ